LQGVGAEEAYRSPIATLDATEARQHEVIIVSERFAGEVPSRKGPAYRRIVPQWTRPITGQLESSRNVEEHGDISNAFSALDK